jgi:hypothetical protein
MAGRTSFGDVELMLLEYLATGERYMCTDAPPNMASVLSSRRVVRVNRIGGGEDGDTDLPRVRVDVFALASSADPRAAHNEASAIRSELRNLPAVTTHGRLDRARTDSGPVRMPWSDEAIVRVQQIFRVSTRA